jgi:hypothetical protein
MFYINRGLFVAMPGVEISCPSGNEINSLLEIIINWAGGQNDLDEDGDLPETYNIASSLQPLINTSLTDTLFGENPCTQARIIFCISDETILSSGALGNIDPPPKTNDNC